MTPLVNNAKTTKKAATILVWRDSMRHFLTWIFALLILSAPVGVLPAQATEPQPAISLVSVKKVYVGSMGQSDEAERFRLLLQDELGKAGFTTTEDERTADAVLSGALSVRVYARESIARATVVLKTPDGVRIWEHDFQPHFKFGARDTVKVRAHDVARALRSDVEHARRKS